MGARSLAGAGRRLRKLAGPRNWLSIKGAAHKSATLYDSSLAFYSCNEDAVTLRIDLRQDKPTKCYTCKEDSSDIAFYSIKANPLKSGWLDQKLQWGFVLHVRVESSVNVQCIQLVSYSANIWREINKKTIIAASIAASVYYCNSLISYM